MLVLHGMGQAVIKSMVTCSSTMLCQASKRKRMPVVAQIKDVT